jgi:hypothetical protein
MSPARILEMPKATVAEPCAGRPRALALFERAIDRLYAKHEAAAADMGVSPGQLSKWLSGKERLGVVDLDRVPALRKEFARVLAEDCGFDVQSLDATERRRRLIATKQRELFELMEEETRARVSA